VAWVATATERQIPGWRDTGPPPRVLNNPEGTPGLDRTAAPDNEVPLDRFLTGVQARAVRMAALALGDREAALDAVQDAMEKLITRYGDRSESEWTPLFWRILQSRIMDTHRRRSVRNRVVSIFGFGRGGHNDDGRDPGPDDWTDTRTPQPDQALDDARFGGDLEAALCALPLRQQQAFLLRVWEGLNTAQTAEALGISEGSVKTHVHRAMAALRQRLEAYQ
jgi:RNA polymerase sigma-70 factor, ECF subfamily